MNSVLVPLFQYDEVNVQKNKAVAAVHALRAKVARLAKKCQEKVTLAIRMFCLLVSLSLLFIGCLSLSLLIFFSCNL